jgi:3-oxoacyl-[acyl-carrier protein] reductase
MNAKTALITGASSDVGKAVALSLAACGFNIAAHYHSNLTAVRVIKNEVGKYGVQAMLYRHDLKQSRQAKEMVDAVMSQFSSIDVLVNTIGPFYLKDVLEFTPEEWSEIIDLNLNIAFNVTYFAREQICASKGHIINFAFSGAEHLRAWSMATAYGAAKAGIVILTKTLATSLASTGVRVNAICPGLIEESWQSKQNREQLACKVPVGRLGRPDEIAETVKWLVTDSPLYVTGALIAVAGAWEQ